MKNIYCVKSHILLLYIKIYVMVISNLTRKPFTPIRLTFNILFWLTTKCREPVTVVRIAIKV